MNNESNAAQIKVLGLQELSDVAGGNQHHWSTESTDCTTADTGVWSTPSADCGPIDFIQR